MPGECVISLVLSAAAKIWNGAPVLQLGYSSVLFSKQRVVYLWGMRVGWPQRRSLSPSWLPLFICFFSSPLSLPCANWASQEGHVFISPEVLTLVHRFSFVSFSWTLSFLCFSSLPFWTPFSYSNYLTKPNSKRLVGQLPLSSISFIQLLFFLVPGVFCQNPTADVRLYWLF